MHFILLPFLVLLFFPDILDRLRNGRVRRSDRRYEHDDSYDERDPFFDEFEQADSNLLYDTNAENRSTASLENLVFKLAKAKSGRLTLSEAVIETNLQIKQAEQFMNKLVDGIHVTVDVDDNGRMIYLFPELVEGN